jgi:histidinol-phosphate/aromatic aminotransferase/cobyric acid decarboxylase-like protein
MLKQITSFGITKIILVVGYKANELKQFISELPEKYNITYVENPVYETTNNIYSLYLAKNYLLKDDTLLFESDLIFEDNVIDVLLKNSYPNLALVAKFESWMDGTAVIIDKNDNIVKFIDKESFEFEKIKSYFKTVNIYKFSKDFSTTRYVPFLEAYSKALGNNEYYEQVLKVITILNNPNIKALDIKNMKWYEIDDIQDLDIAESIFADDQTKLEKLQNRFGGYWRYPYIKDFCYLVNPYFPNEKLLSEIKANFEQLLTEYPSGLFVNNLLIAKNFGIKKEYVCAGNGAAELIKSLMENIAGKIGIIFPTFEEYPNRKDKNQIAPFIPQNSDFSYSAEDIKNYYADKNISTLLLINPDNPSGNFIKIGDVLELAVWAKNMEIRLIVDESFVDFTDDFDNNSLLNNEILEANKNLTVVKSISKSYGVPGLRLGFMASSDMALVENIRKNVAIWNINSFAEFYLQIFGKYENDYKKACQIFIDERQRFFKKLDKISFLRAIPSQANYFLCEVTQKYSSLELSKILLNKYHILIKDCGHKSAFAEKNYVRISVRDTKDNDELIEKLEQL